jgi:replicative DNA helicase
MIDNERNLLGACFIDSDAVDVALSLLSVQDLALDPHRVIFAKMVAMAEAKTEINLVTLSTELRKGGKLADIGGTDYLVELTNSAISYSENSVRYSCREIKEQATKRKLRGLAEAINRNIDTMSAAELQAKIEAAIYAMGEKKTEGPVHAKDTLKEVMKQIEHAHTHKGCITGIPSGINKLDAILCGFNPADLTILAARPSMGKSAFAGNVVENVSVRGELPSLIFSCEMSRDQWVKRILFSLARVDGARARIGNFAEGDWPKMTNGFGYISNSKVWIDDAPGIHISELRARARRLHRKEGIGLVVVDYMQLMTGEGQSREQEISGIARGLKGMAKELNIPVIALSQLNRKVEERANKRPTMSDLRESGAIEQDADNILFLYRDAVYNDKANEGEAEIIVAKQRNGPTGMVPATWIGGYSRFENAAEAYR